MSTRIDYMLTKLISCQTCMHFAGKNSYVLCRRLLEGRQFCE